MKFKIALITVYFGSLPSYFNLWLASAEKNRDIDFFIVTDAAISTNSDNIKVVTSTLDEINDRANKALKMKCKISYAYKLCDYKPAYGLIFSEFLKGYDFWGHCDIDIIWGNIRSFLTDDILGNHNKIFNLGHLTLYKNDNRTNHIFMKTFTGVHYTYKEAFKLDYNTGFDEKGAIYALSVNGNYRMYDNKDIIADIWPDTKRYRTFYTYKSDYDHIYSYQKGRLVGHFLVENDIHEKEFLYIHLQKRKMECCLSSTDEFLIVPDKFIDLKPIECSFIREYSDDTTPISINMEQVKHKMPIILSLRRRARRLIFARIFKIDQ